MRQAVCRRYKIASRPGRALAYFASLALAFLLAWAPPPASAQNQVLNVGYATSQPQPASGHDYLHGLEETVDPGNGSMNLAWRYLCPRAVA